MTSLKKQFTRIAAYGLVLQSRSILLCRLSEQVAEAGCWTLPGGGIDFGEDPADAMIREVHEETGFNVRPRGLAGIDSVLLENEERDFHGIRIIYQTELIGGTMTYELEESTDFCAWWSYEEAKKLPLVNLTEIGLALAFPNG